MVPKERHHWTDTFGREWPGLLRPSSWPLSPQKSTPTLISHKHLHWSLNQGQGEWPQLQPPSPRKPPRTQTRTRPRSQDRFATRDTHARGLAGLGVRERQQKPTTPPTSVTPQRHLGTNMRCRSYPWKETNDSFPIGSNGLKPPHKWWQGGGVAYQMPGTTAKCLEKKLCMFSRAPPFKNKNASCHLTPAISICSSLSLVVLPNLSNWPVFGSSSHDSLIKHLIWTLFSKFTGA